MSAPDIEVSSDVSHSAWHNAVRNLPNQHFLQTWEWGELKQQYGWQAQRFLCARGKQHIAAFTLLTRPLPVLPWTIGYVPKGPLLDYSDTSLFAAVLDTITAAARAARAVYVKIDPDLPADNASAIAVYRAHGWQPSQEQIQFPNTALLDLSGGQEALLAAMKPKTRYNIRLAARRGVEIAETTDWPTLFHLYAQTAERDAFAIREEGYYHALWSTFQESGKGRGLVARVEGQPVAGMFLMHFGDTGWFFTGASSNAHRDKMPNYLLQWHAIQWLAENDYRRYDLWGAPTVMDASDPLWGVYRFKSGFGARYVRRLGAYDHVPRPGAYWLLTRLMPSYRHLRRRLNG